MTKRKNKVYVVHFCKNKDCNHAWIDEDLTNAKTRPPRWRYCEGCCKKYNYINPPKPPRKILSTKQKEILEQNKFKPKIT